MTPSRFAPRAKRRDDPAMPNGSGTSDGFDPSSVLPASRALTPAVVKVYEQRVAVGFWPKLFRVVRRIPFAPELLAVYYCARDPETPATAKGLLMAALAYFVMPFDAIPDMLVGIGYTDDAAVIATVLVLVGRHLKPSHKLAARDALDRLARDA